MKLKGKVVLVTGANGGIGGALVKALLDKGVAKVYAAARTAAAAASLVQLDPDRVVAVQLDVTDAAAVATAAEKCTDVDVLVNNAGVNRGMWLTGPAGVDAAREEMEVNFFGTLAMCRAFVPVLASREGGVMVTICSIIGLVSMPLNGTYCTSKAAVHSMLQGLRGELAPRNIRVVGVYPGPVETRMTVGLKMPKSTPEQIAEAIMTGLEKEKEDIFPDPVSRGVRAQLQWSVKKAEKEFAALVPA
ncbi:MAG TPA: SDR family oxidoreductase [Anaerolineales bacterium]